MASERVLVVDDNAQNLKLTRVLLTVTGYEVQTAVDAEEALLRVDSFRPQLILMDLQLPGMDGLELTRQLKADPTRKNILIIALTAYAMKGDEERALAAGCDGYLSKPVNTERLCQTVAEKLASVRPTIGQDTKGSAGAAADSRTA